jgi:hypothetical protein
MAITFQQLKILKYLRMNQERRWVVVKVLLLFKMYFACTVC